MATVIASVEKLYQNYCEQSCFDNANGSEPYQRPSWVTEKYGGQRKQM